MAGRRRRGSNTDAVRPRGAPPEIARPREIQTATRRAGQGRRRAHEAGPGLDVRGGDGAFGCAAAATTVRVPRPAARGMSRRWREDRTTHRPPPKPKQQTIGGPSIDFQEFVRRQGRDSSRRARKAEARQKEKPRECSFKPRLCENSKRMARNSKFDDRAAPASRESRRWRMREPKMRATRRRPEPPGSAAPPAHGERR